MTGRTKAVSAAVICAVLCAEAFGASWVSAADAILADGGSAGGSVSKAVQEEMAEEAAPPAEEGCLLVTFREDVTQKKAEAAADKVDGEIADRIDEEMDVALIEIDEAQDKERAMRRLERLPQVEAVQPNYIYFTTVDETEGEGSEEGHRDAAALNSAGGATASEYDSWPLKYMQVQKAWDLIDRIRPEEERTDKDRIKVAILDTGVCRHEDLQENMDWENSITVIESEQGSEAFGAAEEPEYAGYSDPAQQHGTGVAGLIAADSYNGIGMAGVAAGNHNDLIELMGIKVFREGNYVDQSSTTTADIVKGLRYACRKEARVINMCLGHEPGAKDGEGGYHDDGLLAAEIERAVKEDDVVITCSAGNNGDTRTWYPSDLKSVISAINTTRYTDAWSRDVKDPTSSYGRKKDISAPGSKVYVTRGTKEYKRRTGTSYSASYAAGVAALVRYVDPELTAAEVKDILCSTATDLYKDGYDKYTGYGNLNAYKAVAKAAGVKLPEGMKKSDKTVRMTKAKAVGRKTIEVRWKASKGAGGYYLYRSTAKKSGYEKIAHIQSAGITKYRDTGRARNKKYYYKIAVLGTSKSTKEKTIGEYSRPIAGRI